MRYVDEISKVFGRRMLLVIGTLSLLLTNFTLALGADELLKTPVLELKKIARTVEMPTASFQAFNYYVGKLSNGEEVVLWKTIPENFNCHFFSIRPFFNFAGENYWLDSATEHDESSQLNQGIDALGIFLDSYFKRVAFRNITQTGYYQIPSLEKRSIEDMDVRRNDIFILENGMGTKVHSGRFVGLNKKGLPLIISKMGGGDISTMTLQELLQIKEFSETAIIKIYRYND